MICVINSPSRAKINGTRVHFITCINITLRRACCCITKQLSSTNAHTKLFKFYLKVSVSYKHMHVAAQDTASHYMRWICSMSWENNQEEGQIIQMNYIATKWMPTIIIKERKKERKPSAIKWREIRCLNCFFLISQFYFQLSCDMFKRTLSATSKHVEMHLMDDTSNQDKWHSELFSLFSIIYQKNLHIS